jgi:hypothetical protein
MNTVYEVVYGTSQSFLPSSYRLLSKPCIGRKETDGAAQACAFLEHDCKLGELITILI